MHLQLLTQASHFKLSFILLSHIIVVCAALSTITHTAPTTTNGAPTTNGTDEPPTEPSATSQKKRKRGDNASSASAGIYMGSRHSYLASLFAALRSLATSQDDNSMAQATLRVGVCSSR